MLISIYRKIHLIVIHKYGKNTNRWCFTLRVTYSLFTICTGQLNLNLSSARFGTKVPLQIETGCAVFVNIGGVMWLIHWILVAHSFLQSSV